MARRPNAAAAVLALSAAAAATAQPPRILVFSKTAGFRHDSIPAGIAALQAIADQHCIALDASEDAAAFSPSNLARFQAVVFLSTTGDILDPSQQQAFEDWFSAGHAWLGIHAAADTEYDWPFYGDLLGGAWFANHPAPQTAAVLVEDHTPPSTSFLPTVWPRTDEWYNFQQNPRPLVQVLLRLDESSYSGGTMGDHPIAWCRFVHGGRAWYTAGGHTIETYSEPLFRQHLRGGLLWAMQLQSCLCYANCDNSTQSPTLNVADFTCFLQKFAAADPWANCDNSNQPPILNVADFTCFLQRFAAGCP